MREPYGCPYRPTGLLLPIGPVLDPYGPRTNDRMGVPKPVSCTHWSCTGPYDARMGPYDSRMGPYDARMGPYDARMGPYDARMGPYDARMGPYDARMGLYDAPTCTLRNPSGTRTGSCDPFPKTSQITGRTLVNRLHAWYY